MVDQPNYTTEHHNMFTDSVIHARARHQSLQNDTLECHANVTECYDH